MTMMLFMPTSRWAKTVHIDLHEPGDADRTPCEHVVLVGAGCHQGRLVVGVHAIDHPSRRRRREVAAALEVVGVVDRRTGRAAVRGQVSFGNTSRSWGRLQTQPMRRLGASGMGSGASPAMGSGAGKGSWGSRPLKRSCGARPLK